MNGCPPSQATALLGSSVVPPCKDHPGWAGQRFTPLQQRAAIWEILSWLCSCSHCLAMLHATSGGAALHRSWERSIYAVQSWSLLCWERLSSCSQCGKSAHTPVTSPQLGSVRKSKQGTDIPEWALWRKVVESFLLEISEGRVNIAFCLSWENNFNNSATRGYFNS